MQIIAQCIPNLEEISIKEIKELINQESKIIIPGRIKFNATKEEIKKLAKKTRSILKIYLFIEKIEFKELDDLEEQIKKIKFPEIKEPFAAKCERKGNHNFTSNDIEIIIGDSIKNKKVDLKNPETIIIADILKQDCLIGIEISNNLSKRDYRIKILSNSINPCLAYCMLRISEVKEKETILDPSCKSGEIIIEAFLSFKTLKGYATDSLLNHLKALEINSKIAQVYKKIEISRQDIEWLDTKFNEEEIDHIITFPPYPSKIFKEKKAERLYKDLFHAGSYILKEKGNITILTNSPKLLEKTANSENFKLKKQYKLNYMNQEFYILVFSKSFK
ncbi:methyltransferase [Candidatus Woesearchaeota archaeon]|nr:methyltransferase [Candidatus Woesearchaeota archaeon]